MAYETFYRLKYEPFAVQPDPRFYFNGPQHAVAREYLLHAAEGGRGLALLLGEIGTGKTTLVRSIWNELLEDDRYHIGFTVLTRSVKPRWLLDKFAEFFDIEDPPEDSSELFSIIVNRLFEIHNAGNRTLIFMDEANKMDNPDTIEELRGFVNLESPSGKKLVTFILVGLPDLEVNLAQNAALYQRIAVRVNLNPLTLSAVKAYVQHRLRIAGRDNPIFTEKALAEIASYSGGRPRLVNIICDNSLIEGYIQRKPKIDEFIVKHVANNLNLIPKEINQ
ncbi:AAA family ATPase [candidate division WOR-3 bacterium]|uniref:AAA family ATPase n=1 Tax=candidate division WOR-3 bacterium TaxID=2052148 RepID=A0A9D5QCY7_UNCW3|nr:AAA family ATPase [candidate division WOR-3 bacterium]MBD3365173.1 AAA family ATPase [candidate division WOR-3 bacterium]